MKTTSLLDVSLNTILQVDKSQNEEVYWQSIQAVQEHLERCYKSLFDFL